MKTRYYKFKHKIFDIIQLGQTDDPVEKFFDGFIVIVIFLNLFVTLFDTFEASAPYKDFLNIVEFITILIFTIEYILRLWTSDYLYPNLNKTRSLFRFIFSFYGIIDLLTFFPYYLPIMFPAGAVAFRMLRVIRIFRLFKINSQIDAFNVITNVLIEKKNQLLSSVMLILMMMTASSLCMYSLENAAQPEQFSNAFSGIWWSVSTLLTVGYGDIYPITTGGRIMAIVISFLGVGMVAIPTGIISAGFVEQYTKIKKAETYAEEKELKFSTSIISDNHPWKGQKVKDVIFPPGFILIMIIRNGTVHVPKGDTDLHANDLLVFAAKHYNEPIEIKLKEILIKDENEWVGKPIRDLDISRQELIVMIERGDKRFIPNGSSVIEKNDKVIMYSRL